MFYALHGNQLECGQCWDAAGLDTLARYAISMMPGAPFGSWTSPSIELPEPLMPGGSIMPSWQAHTPIGSYISVNLRVQRQDLQWSKWFGVGEWVSNDISGSLRRSLDSQADSFGRVDVDTYVNTSSMAITAFQIGVRLYSNGGDMPPRVFQLAAEVANEQVWQSVSQTTMRGTIDLPVPELSQYVHGQRDGSNAVLPELGGGRAWCSPTAVTMVLRYWGVGPSAEELAMLPDDPTIARGGRADADVVFAALRVFDPNYGAGNWAFNTAYAATYGLDAAVRVFRSLQDVEALVQQSIPAIISLAWESTDALQPNSLPGASIESSSGHLLVIRGFTEQGDVIVNDPASPLGNSDVARIYPRASVERCWINAGGVAYVIKPLQ